MTALAGVWRFDGRPDADDRCARMLAAQRMYGVDDVGQWSDHEIALGRRLTRILPEDKFDTQPLIGGRGRYVLVADVRLDNRDDLVRDLGIQDSRARTLSDAAVLLATIERWREGCIERLVGDYAFAYWDAASRSMLLVRDPLGHQPLHFHRSNKFFAFASMPKGLHALADIPYAPDEERIAEKLLMMPESGTQSFFKGIERVPQGHFAIVTTNSIAIRRHWEPARRPVRYSKTDEYAEALLEKLDLAVSSQLRGTGNIGAYLSGGLDSGAVVATAARLLAPSGRRIFAFTGVPRCGYRDPGFVRSIHDEGRYAAATAELYPNIDHVLVHNEGCTAERPGVADLDATFYLYDRPATGFSDAGMARSYQKAFAQRDIQVSLSGSAGNCGLSYDGMELLPELLRSGHWLHLAVEAHALVRSGRMGWRGVARETLGPWCPGPLWQWLHRQVGRDLESLDDYSGINTLKLAEIDQSRKDAHDFALRPSSDGFASRLWHLQRTDPGNFRKGILAGYKVDERDPTSDIRLLNFCFSVPTDQFLRRGVPRALALRALSDRLPAVVLEPRLARQIADWKEDLSVGRAAMAEELDRIEGCPAAASAIDVPRLREMLTNWPAEESRWHTHDVWIRYRFALPRAIAAGHFLRRASRSNQ
jgi:asparagine synthase (glutamine-hydrolysing)